MVNASTVELLDVETYVAETVGQRPLVLWNLELDTLRADLGALSSCTASLRSCPLSVLLSTTAVEIPQPVRRLPGGPHACAHASQPSLVSCLKIIF